MNQNKTKVNAMILAAGLGTRLRPVTADIPKPLVPICGRPLLENILINLDAAGVADFAVNTHYLSEKMRAFVEKSQFENRVKLYHEDEILGTGGPLVNAKSTLADADAILLHNGDILTDLDFNALIDFHVDKCRLVTMVLIDGPENRVKVSPEGVVLDILDRIGDKSENFTRMTYTGIMMLSPEIFRFLPDYPENCSIITGILSMLREIPGSLISYRPENFYWNDLGTVRQFFQAHLDILRNSQPKMIDMPSPNDFQFLASNAEIASSAELSGAIFVSENCFVGEKARLNDCILLPGAKIDFEEARAREIISPDWSVHHEIDLFRQLDVLSDYDFGDCVISSLAEQGSNRRFFRVRTGDESRILMLSDSEDPDFERYVHIGRFVRRFCAVTPEIFKVRAGESAVLMEDLGDDTICRLSSVDENFDANEIYRLVIERLLEFQTKITKPIMEDTFPIRFFKYEYLRWESDYFRRRFLADYCDCDPVTIAQLDPEFDFLAQEVLTHPQVMIHRDFQSQNILVKDGKARFVDFQGARIGSVCYDIMSLLRDPYMDINEDFRREMLEFYREGLIEEGIVLSKNEFAKFAAQAGLQRNMQALGAYGYLSLVKGKSKYKKYIPLGLRYLREGLAELANIESEPRSLPLLRGIVESL